MPFGAKRRKAAKKKKEKKAAVNVIPNGNGEVKVTESDGGENSSPASQDIETQQNPFSKDENKEPSPLTESVENRKMMNGDEDVMEIVVQAKLEMENVTDNGSVKDHVNKSTSESLSVESVDDGSRVDEVQLQKEDGEDSSVVKDAVSTLDPLVEIESNAVVRDKVIKDPESGPVQTLVGSAVAELKLKNREEKVHPSETLSEVKADGPSLSDINSWESSREIVTKQLPQSSSHIGNGECRAASSEIHQSPEKEPLLLPATKPASRTSWTSCCGLLELFTGSS